MEPLNSISRLSKVKKSKDGSCERVVQGVTKILLEKYKPKSTNKIKSLSNKDLQRRAA